MPSQAFSQAQLHSVLKFFTSHSPSGSGEWGKGAGKQGNGGYQSVTTLLCCSFFLTVSPHCISPSHGMQSFRINLLHYELYSLWFPQEMSTSSGMGSFVGCSVDMCFSVILSTGLQGNLCFDAWNTSLLLFFSDLGVHKVASPTFFFLSPPFLSFLKYLLTEDHPA